MTTLAALLADVYSITNRPDLTAESTVAVKAAVLKAHQSDFFPRDIITGSFTFASPSLNVQAFTVSTLTRWRAWSYLQNFSPTSTPNQPSDARLFDILTPNNLFDEYNILKADMAWQVGMTLNLRSAVALPVLYYGFYQNQNITDINDMGWISDSHPYAIVFEAARVVFKMIGWDAEAAEYNKLSAEQFLELRLSNVLTVGM